MFESKNRAALIVAAIGLLSIGYGACWVTKPAPEPDIQWNFRDGLTVNGKRVDLDKLGVKLPLPVLPAPEKGKRKPGDLPSGDLPKAGPAAFYFDIEQKNVLKNITGSDGAGINIPVCLEAIARHQGYQELVGFSEWASKRPGGHWPAKTQRQFEEYKTGKTIPVDLVIVETDKMAPDTILSLLKAHGPIVAAYEGRFPDHFHGRRVSVGVVLNGYKPAEDGDKFSMIEPNYPLDRISLPTNTLALGCQWIAYFVQNKKTEATPEGFVLFDQDPLSPYPHMQNVLAVVNKGDKLDCPCGESCKCKPCHCHAAKPITFNSEDDQPMVVGQRGGNGGAQILGIDTLVAVLQKFHDSFFGTGNRPGVKDDISGGLKEFWGSVKVGFIAAGVTTLVMLGWIGLSLQRIADKA